jgi:hypothetical protein
MKSLLTALCAVAVGLVMTVCPSPVHADSSGLISLLTSRLGVTNAQAEGGSGALLGHAKQKLSADDFSKVTDAMPETESLIEAAPKAEKAGGLAEKLGGASSLLGGGEKTSSLAGMAGLANSFSSLGLSSDMVGKFVPIILEYAKSKGGDSVSSILKGALQ